MHEGAAFDRRFIDNTLPQSAFHFLVCRGRRSIPLDPAARITFETFVDTFVNSPLRISAIPGKDAGIGDEFIQLWQTTADEVGRDAGLPSATVDGFRMLDSYILSLFRSPENWSGWLRFQLTHEIGRQYRSRVQDWRERLGQAVVEIRSRTSALSRVRDDRIVRFRDDILAGALNPAPWSATDQGIDPNYTAYVSSTGTDLATFAIAYGYDWYRRGYTYRRWSADNTWIAFHPLRADVVLDVERSSTEIRWGIREVRWARILVAYLDRGLLPFDPLVISEILQAFRAGVHMDKKIDFTQQMHMASGSTDPVRRDRLYRDAIIDVLRRADIRPILRTSGRRDERLDIIKRLSIEGLELAGAGVVAPIVGELLRATTKSSRFEPMSYRFRRRFRPRTLWRLYEVPGLTDVEA